MKRKFHLFVKTQKQIKQNEKPSEGDSGLKAKDERIAQLESEVNRLRDREKELMQ